MVAVQGLHPVLESCGKLAGGAAELLQQELGVSRIRIPHFNRNNELFAVEKYVLLLEGLRPVRTIT
jgi:hypothetical protein